MRPDVKKLTSYEYIFTVFFYLFSVLFILTHLFYMSSHVLPYMYFVVSNRLDWRKRAAALKTGSESDCTWINSGSLTIGYDGGRSNASFSRECNKISMQVIDKCLRFFLYFVFLGCWKKIQDVNSDIMALHLNKIFISIRGPNAANWCLLLLGRRTSCCASGGPCWLWQYAWPAGQQVCQPWFLLQHPLCWWVAQTSECYHIRKR